MSDYNPVTESVEGVAETLICAPKMEQAKKVIFAEICRMREQSPILTKRSTNKHKEIQVQANNGEMRCISSDRPLSGTNASCVIFDEYHEFRHALNAPIVETMLTGSGSRTQPIFLFATTAGNDKSDLWLPFHRYCKDILSGVVTDHRVFPYIFQLDEDDDVLDPGNWPKANPNLGISLHVQFLQDQVAEARSLPSSLRTFTRYHANRIVSSTEDAFDLHRWDECRGELSDWKEADAIGGGVDLGGRDDLASLALCARYLANTKEDGTPVYRYEFRSWSYIAEDTRRDLTQQPFADWVHHEYLRQAKFPITELTSKLIELSHDLHICDIAYDPYNGQVFAEQIENEGMLIASMAQTTRHFNEPIAELQQAILDGRIKHDGNPLLRWAVSNAVLTADHCERIMYSKSSSRDKIDPLVACTMAFRRAMLAPQRSQGPLVVI